MNTVYIGESVLLVLLVVLVLSALWPFLPSSGPFSQIPNTIEAAIPFVITAIVIGAPSVAYYLLSGW